MLLISEFIERLAWVKAYIVRQREYHARGTVQDRFGRVTEMDAQTEAKEARSPVNGAG